MAKKFFVLLMMGLFMMSMVSAVWWNPFTWFDDDENVIIGKSGKWVLEYTHGIQEQYFDTTIENLDNGKAKICLLPKIDLSINHNIVMQSKATLKNNNIETRQVQPSDMEVETEGGNVKKMCVDVDYLNEDNIKFGEHSTVVTYEEEVLEVTDSDGEPIAEIILKTDDWYYKNDKPNVNYGYGTNQIVHSFQINKIQNYSNIFDNVYFKNMRTGEIIERDFQLKYLVYEDALINDSGCVEYAINESCESYGVVGSHIETREVWYNLTQEILDANNIITVGVETLIKKGDYVDVGFDFAGVDVGIFWATWEGDFLVDNTFWYKFEESSGDAVDSAGNFTGTSVGINYQDTGVIDFGYHFDGETQDRVEVNGAFNWDESSTWTINAWFNVELKTDDNSVFSTDISNGDSPRGVFFFIESDNDKWTFADSGILTVLDNVTSIIGENTILTISYDGSGAVKFYKDGTQVYTLSRTLVDATDTNLFTIGTRNTDGKGFDGEIDELSLWERELSQSEITDLVFAIQNGCSYNDDSCFISPPSSTLISPINTTNYTTTNTVNFEYSCTDAVKVDNCTLYIDGVSENVNTSGVNGTYSYSTGFLDGYYNWSVVAWNNESSATSETWFFNVSYQTGIDITLNTPVDTANFTTTQATFNVDVTDNFGVENVSLYIDGVLNATDTSQTNGTYQWIRDVADGSHSWFIEVYDNDSNGVNSSTYNFNMDTTPFIEFLTPPTFIDNINISSETIPMGVNISTLYFQNITYSLRDVNGTNYTQFFANETLEYNFTDIPDAHYDYDVTVCTTTLQCNTTETRHINHDTLPPVITSAFNLTNLTTLSPPINSTWNFNATDIHIDDCYYNTTDHATEVVICNSTISTQWNTAGLKEITFCANDTFGIESCTTTEIIVYHITTSTSDVPDPVIEGSQVQYDLFVNELGVGIPSTSAVLIHNGTTYSVDLVSSNSSTYHFQENITILSGLGSLTGQNLSFYWEYNVTGLLTNEQTASETTTVFSIEFDDCSNFSDVIMNWSLYDEETSTEINGTAGSNVELDLTMADPLNEDLFWTFNFTWIDITQGAVCIPTGLLGNDTNYLLDLIFGFDSTDRVWEFYYLDGGSLTDESGFNAITENPIILMDLKTVDSTSFLFNFFDKDGLPIADSIVHVFRKYIGEGVFKEVERSKADQNGDTIVHLVEEDVIYKFLISLDGVQQFISSTYTALCQSTPCTIQIEASGLSATFPDDWDLIDGGAYSISSDGSTRNISLTYSFNESDTINLTVYKYNSDGSYSSVGEVSDTGRSGVIFLTVPQVAGNISFFTTVDKGGEYIDSEWVDFNVRASDRLGIVMSLFLSALIILTLGLFAVNEGVGTIAYVVLGVFISGALGLLRTDLSTGVNIVVYLVLAGALLIWKLTRGRR